MPGRINTYVTHISNHSITPEPLQRDLFDSAKESFTYAAEIRRAFGDLGMVIDWCKMEMRDVSWRWQMIDLAALDRPGRYIFYFNDERDYCAFVLKWR